MGKRRKSIFDTDPPSLPLGLVDKLLNSVRSRVAKAGWPVDGWKIDAGYQYDRRDRVVDGFLVIRGSANFMGRRFAVWQVTSDDVVSDPMASRVIAPILAAQAIEFLDANA